MQYNLAYQELKPVQAHILMLALHTDVLLLNDGFAVPVYKHMHLDTLGCWAQVVIIVLRFCPACHGPYMDQVIKLPRKLVLGRRVGFNCFI